MVQRLLAHQIFRPHARWVAYPGTVLIIGLAYATSQWLWPSFQAFPFFFYFPALILSALVFGHGCGYLAVGLSGALLLFDFEPRGRFLVASPRDALALVMFLVVGLVMSALVEALRKALERAQAAEAQKELFLQEAVHRFKNDITIVTALLRMQSRRLDAGEAGEAQAVLLSTADRVQVMARVHDRLRLGPGLMAEVDAQAFVEDLCADLRTSLLDLRPIQIEVAAEPHSLPHEQAVSVGLIINEALTNALKYAFPEDRSGTVSVAFRRLAGAFLLQVKDDGVGFDPERPTRSGGMGQHLVQAMARQLGGSLDVEPDSGAPGTVVTVRFPARDRSAKEAPLGTIQGRPSEAVQRG